MGFTEQGLSALISQLCVLSLIDTFNFVMIRKPFTQKDCSHPEILIIVGLVFNSERLAFRYHGDQIKQTNLRLKKSLFIFEVDG